MDRFHVGPDLVSGRSSMKRRRRVRRLPIRVNLTNI